MTNEEKKLLKEAGEASKVHAARAKERLEHTPGPWHVAPQKSYTPFRREVKYGPLEIWPKNQRHAKIATILDGDGREVTKKNAALIAAAPELLRMLKLVIMCDIKMPENWNFNQDGEPTTEESESDAIARMYNDCLKAIVEAEGR